MDEMVGIAKGDGLACSFVVQKLFINSPAKHFNHLQSQKGWDLQAVYTCR